MDLFSIDHMPTVKSAMTPFPYYVLVSDPITRAESLMVEHDVHHLPVRDGDALVGVLTKLDLDHAVNPAVPKSERAQIRVGSICRYEPYEVDADMLLVDVLDGMAERHIRSAIVVRGGKLVGIFSAVDACRILGEALRRHFPSPGPDEVA